MVDKRTTPMVPLWTVCSVNQSFELGGLGMTWGVNFSLLDNSSDYEAVQELNREKAKLLVPVIAYTIILLVVGAVGNTLAIYIYGFKWHSTTTRVFLLWLAVIDLVNCIITMPTEIYIMTNFYYFPGADFCRMSRFITYLINNSSAAVFIVIAVDRYIRICHPHRKTISVNGSQVACIFSLCVGFGVSWPALVLYGNKMVPLPRSGNKTGYIYGVICDVKNEMDRTPYPAAFFIYLWCAFFTCFIIITILYTLIGRVMLQRSRRRSTNSTAEISYFETSRSKMRKADSGSFNKGHNGSSYNGVGRSSQRKATFESSRTYENRNSYNETYTTSLNSTISIFEFSRIRPSKSTLMLFAISAVFVMSFLPFLVIMKIRQHIGPSFYPTLSPSEQVVINLFSRSYLVNNCANPIVYGMCNSQFRNKVKKLFQFSNTRLEPALSRMESRALTDGF